MTQEAETYEMMTSVEEDMVAEEEDMVPKVCLRSLAANTICRSNILLSVLQVKNSNLAHNC